MTTPPWTDWLTESFFRIRVAPPAAAKLQQLPPGIQLRLRQMLQDITDLADLVPPSASETWRESDSEALLHLRLGRVDVRYSLSEKNRTLTIEHVIIPSAEDLEKTG